MERRTRVTPEHFTARSITPPSCRSALRRLPTQRSLGASAMEHEIESVTDSPEVALEARGFVIARWLRTLGQALHPIRSAGSFARSTRLAAPIAFLFTTWLPLAFLQGIVPFTHTLRFGDRFGVELIGSPSRDVIVLDLLRAGGLSLLVQGSVLVAMLASFASLCRAYGRVPEGAAEDDTDGPLRRFAVRALLYRAFWLPLGGAFGVPSWLVYWGAPAESGASLWLAVALVTFAGGPLMMAFVSLRHAARRSCGVGPLASFAVVAVPFVLGFVVEQVLVGEGLGGVLEPWLPDVPPAPEPVG
jgi:hypothetical protein